jgi:hypothetical protein
MSLKPFFVPVHGLVPVHVLRCPFSCPVPVPILVSVPVPALSLSMPLSLSLFCECPCLCPCPCPCPCLCSCSLFAVAFMDEGGGWVKLKNWVMLFISLPNTAPNIIFIFWWTLQKTAVGAEGLLLASPVAVMHKLHGPRSLMTLTSRLHVVFGHENTRKNMSLRTYVNKL